ncbi:MAG: hypothetical protein ACRDLR_10305, partial [Gaiellaceae bacterium]
MRLAALPAWHSLARAIVALVGMLALGAAARPALAASPAGAEPASVSYSTWIVRDRSVLLRFALPVAEA